MSHKTKQNNENTNLRMGTSGGVMVNKLDEQTFTSEFKSYWSPINPALFHIWAKY